MHQADSNKTPAPDIVISHFVFGGFVLLLVAVLIIIYPGAFTHHYFNPQLLSITHLLVLGWISMVVFGVLYQLIPVILDVALYSEKLARVSFVCLAVGSLSLSFSFLNFWTGLPLDISAMLVILAVILMAINIFITASKSPKESIHKNFILTAIVWLLFTVGIGLMLAINLANPFLTSSHLEFLKLHAHAGIAGWLIQLVIGVGSRLLPMFMVSHHLNEKKLWIAYFLINIGLITGIVSLYMQWTSGITLGVLLVISGMVAFVSFLLEAFRKRVKRHLDIGMKQSVASFTVLLIPAILVILLTTDMDSISAFKLPVSIAYVSAILLGFITSLIMGQTYKILPFVVWLKVYRNRVGKTGTPLPKDLYHEKLANIHVWLFTAGFVAILCGIFTENAICVRVAGVILFVAIVLYNLNIYHIVSHKPLKRIDHANGNR
jgi:hypothetical protein